MPVDCLEDWVTAGAPEWEVDARRKSLSIRANQHAVRPAARRRRPLAPPRRVGVALAGRTVAGIGDARPLRCGGDARDAGRPGMARRRTDAQRARRARAALTTPHRAPRPRNPHRSFARLSAAITGGRVADSVAGRATRDRQRRHVHRSSYATTARVAKVSSTPDDPARAVARGNRVSVPMCSRTARRLRPMPCWNDAGRASRSSPPWFRRRDRDRAPGSALAVRPLRRPSGTACSARVALRA